MARKPFLISIPHGGLEIPVELEGRIALGPEDIRYYSDPETRQLFDFHNRTEAFIDTGISRMAVDLNRPPYALPPRHQDGAVKMVTSDGKPVYRSGYVPDIRLIHQIMMRDYFPYHAEVDRLLQQGSVRIAFDCHSMLPVGPSGGKDAGKERPLICLGNNGDERGRAKKGRLSTCRPEWMEALVRAFRTELGTRDEVRINDPFMGGFITNAHYWHTGIPFIQIEVNRILYDTREKSLPEKDTDTIGELRDILWRSLSCFWEEVGDAQDEEDRLTFPFLCCSSMNPHNRAPTDRKAYQSSLWILTIKFW